MIDLRQNIVFVSPFFYPELISTGKANKHLAEAFAADGHSVTVVCSHPLYPDWVPTPSAAQLPGIRILRGGAWLRYPKAMPLRRMVLESWFALYASYRVWRLRKQVDTVVTVLPPSLFAFALHALLPRRVRRVAIVHDLQGLLAAQERSLPRRAIIRVIHAVESRTFQAQDECIFFSQDMARTAQSAYRLDPRRVAVQYPFVTLPPTGAATPGSGRLARLLPPDKLHVVYSGALGYKQNSQELAALMQAAAMRHPEVHFHIFSGGPFFQELRARYESQPEPRLQFHPLVEECDLAELYARSTIQIIPQAEGTEAAALPSKLPNLMYAGVFLLAICGMDSEVGRLVRKTGAGLVIENWRREDFLQGVREALQRVGQESAEMRRRKFEPFVEQFSVNSLVQIALRGEKPASALPSEREEEPAIAGAQRGAHR